MDGEQIVDMRHELSYVYSFISSFAIFWHSLKVSSADV